MRQMAKTYRKMKEEFLYKLELFYRNFGSDWSIEDFSSDRNIQEFLKNYLLTLEEKGIVEIIENNKFRIKNLPSSIISSIL